MHVHLEPQTITLFGKGNCGYHYLMWGHTGLGWALNPMAGVLSRTGEDTEWYTRKKAHVMTQQRLEP